MSSSANVTPQGFRELDRIALGAVAGCESGQSEREDVAARPAFPVHRTRGHDQRMRRVQAAGNTDHDLGIVQRAQPLLEPGNLDVVALVAIPFQAKRIARHEREPFHLALQADVPPTRWVELETDAAERLQPILMVPAIVVEGAHPEPLGAQQVQIDVGDRSPLALRESFGFGQQAAIFFVDHRLASHARSVLDSPLRRRRRRCMPPGSAPPTTTAPAACGLRRVRW